MHKIEVVLWVEPFVFEVFDDEFDIWGYPVRLDSADVVPGYACLWEFTIIDVSVATAEKIARVSLLGNIKSPDSSASSEV